MVHIIFYGLSVIALFVTILLHLYRIRKMKATIKWWCAKCVKYEQELREIKEKQNKRKKNIKGNIRCSTKE
jgi:hypothetical protein